MIMSIVFRGILVKKNYIEHIINCDSTLSFDMLAPEVYEDILTKITVDIYENFSEAERNQLQTDFIDKFDASEDPFVKLVIADVLISGRCYLNTFIPYDKLDKYRGKRHTEFTSVIKDNSMFISQRLIENECQYRLAYELIKVAIRSKNPNTTKVRDQINDMIFKISLTEDDVPSVEKVVFLVPAIDFVMIEEKYRTSSLETKIDQILNFSIKQGDTALTRRAKYNQMGFECIFPEVYQLKINYLHKRNPGDHQSVDAVMKAYAETHLALAKSRINDGEDSLSVAIYHCEEAVKIYNANGFKDELKTAKVLLDKIKWEYMDYLRSHGLGLKINLMDKLQANELNHITELINEFSQQDSESQFISILKSVPIITKTMITEYRDTIKIVNPLSEVFSESIQNEKEQTIYKDTTDANKESRALCKYIQRSGVASWFHILKYISDQNIKIDLAYYISRDDHLSKREYLILKAYKLFFAGDILLALYILTPQIEWWFSEIAYQAGEQTSNLRHFPVEQSKTLTPIFKTDALMEYLGEDWLWLFEELMTKEPMNIRNKIAHGLDLKDTGYGPYFALCVLKFIYEKHSNNENDLE